jgi:tyrosinase
MSKTRTIRSSKKSAPPVKPLIVRTFAQHVVPALLPAAAAGAVVPIVRKSADALTPAEQMVFKNAITRAIADGSYSTLVRIHANMAHDMHTMPGMPAGTYRFLPWHREYLINFEQAMQAFEPTFFVPHWRWVDQTAIPAWMNTFTPPGVTDANGKPIPVQRKPGTSPDPRNRKLPTAQTIQTTVMQATDYLTFTHALEGAQPYGGHNLVHMWFNGTMSRVPVAPADPMFWMNHAEIDRIWWIWQQSHPDEAPSLTGADTVLDPWPETASDVGRIDAGAHPYTYDLARL